jgi:hypothetical protein
MSAATANDSSSMYTNYKGKSVEKMYVPLFEKYDTRVSELKSALSDALKKYQDSLSDRDNDPFYFFTTSKQRSAKKEIDTIEKQIDEIAAEYTKERDETIKNRFNMIKTHIALKEKEEEENKKKLENAEAAVAEAKKALYKSKKEKHVENIRYMLYDVEMSLGRPNKIEKSMILYRYLLGEATMICKESTMFCATVLRKCDELSEQGKENAEFVNLIKEVKDLYLTFMPAGSDYKTLGKSEDVSKAAPATTAEPSAAPSETPAPATTAEPSAAPSETPAPAPTPEPSAVPSETPEPPAAPETPAPASTPEPSAATDDSSLCPDPECTRWCELCRPQTNVPKAPVSHPVLRRSSRIAERPRKVYSEDSDEDDYDDEQ